jgi:hypothetical protein
MNGNILPDLTNEIHNIIFSYVIKNEIWKIIYETKKQIEFLNFFYFKEDHITFKDYHFRKLFLRKLLKQN